MEDFKLSLKALYGKRDPKKDEEYHKNELQAFLKKIFDPAYLVQVKRPIDLAIYNGNDANAKPAVIIEMKSPTNLSEMFSEQHPNTKALQELVYYFLLEYVHFGNREIKHLVISNFDEYYFFDVKDFVRFFANSSKPIYKQFLMFVSKQTSGNKTSDFYNEIAKPAIDDFLASCDINVVHFNLEDACKNVIASPGSKSGINSAKQSNAACHPERSVSGVEGSKKLLPLYKFLSPETLLAIFNSNLVKLWIWYNCPELMGGTREIRKAYFENLRIPLNNTELLHQLATLADEIIAAKKTGEETTELEKRVNEIVYQLYDVTDAEEIETVEKR